MVFSGLAKCVYISKLLQAIKSASVFPSEESSFEKELVFIIAAYVGQCALRVDEIGKAKTNPKWFCKPKIKTLVHCGAI